MRCAVLRYGGAVLTHGSACAVLDEDGPFAMRRAVGHTDIRREVCGVRCAVRLQSVWASAAKRSAQAIDAP
eukprot:3636595-Rhodomonas_salina.1